jgi:hypothetical protein
LNAGDKYPLDMASRTYLKAIFIKILATEDPKRGPVFVIHNIKIYIVHFVIYKFYIYILIKKLKKLCFLYGSKII